MPKLPHVSGEPVIRALERLGFVKARQSGSHVIMRRGSTGCVVPLHSDVKVGILGGVLRQAQYRPTNSSQPFSVQRGRSPTTMIMSVIWRNRLAWPEIKLERIT